MSKHKHFTTTTCLTNAYSPGSNSCLLEHTSCLPVQLCARAHFQVKSLFCSDPLSRPSRLLLNCPWLWSVDIIYIIFHVVFWVVIFPILYLFMCIRFNELLVIDKLITYDMIFWLTYTYCNLLHQCRCSVGHWSAFWFCPMNSWWCFHAQDM